MTSEVPVDRLPESDLGTKGHWDEVYERELRNFKDHSDVGEVWFGEESVGRMVRWIERQDLPNDIKVLDLGCGNGIFLVELAQEGYTNLYGIDYSPAAVSLAQSIADKNGLTIKYMVSDVMKMNELNLGLFDLVADKGTYDAICLCPDGDLRTGYIKAVWESLAPGGFFIITSCNWTEEELKATFESDTLKFYSRVQVPSFSFGGATGQTTSTVIFKRQ